MVPEAQHVIPFGYQVSGPLSVIFFLFQMLPARRNRLVFRPFHWGFLLLLAAALWIGFLRILPIIPTPADVDYERTYFSPLLAAASMYFFRLNAPLLGWRSWPPGDEYTMSFSSVWSGNVPEGECVSFSNMDLQVVPGTLWGSFVHWQVREVVICG